MKRILCLLLLGCCVWAANVQCSFGRGKWDATQWIYVHSYRIGKLTTWAQEENCIRNVCPTDCTAKELLNKRANDTYISMVFKEPVKWNGLRYSATMQFEDRMAPELVLMPAFGKNEKGEPMANELWEIVLYDQGINVWHLKKVNGKDMVSRVAFVMRKFESKKAYKLEAYIYKHWSGKPCLQITCDGTVMGCELTDLPETIYAGIAGCEGVVRFFDFTLKSK